MDKENDWNLGSLLAVSTSYWKACTVHAAVRLDIFSLLGDKYLSAAQVAKRAATDERGVTQLLNALVALRLLKKDRQCLYGNTPFTQNSLDRSSSHYSGHIIMHHHHLVDGWAQLDEAVKLGRPVEMRSYGEENERESFLMGMFNLAMANAPQVAAQVDLNNRDHLLDLGGGPGTYAIHFCLANPELRATIFDRPSTRSFAERTVNRFKMGSRIEFQAGDFLIDDLKGRYDAAWLSQILHSNGPEECERIIAKTVAALEPGGLILIHEFFLNETKDGPVFPALFSLNMLINNKQGRSYSEMEIRTMLSDAGVGDIRRLPFQGPNDSYILYGTV